MFVLNSDITIGAFHFRGVNEVVISSSMHSITGTATIKIPALARITKDDKRNTESVVTGEQFKDGDAVIIKLGYNGTMATEFKGFVKRRDMNMPLEIACEGYSWLLRRNKVNISKTAVPAKDLLSAAIAGIDSKYPITIQCELDCEFNNVQVNGTGLDVVNKIVEYTDGAAACFFIEPDVLWCGLVKTPYSKGTDKLKRGKVQYRLGYNVFKNNTLKKRTTEDDPVQVKYSKKTAAGTQQSQTSDVFKKFARSHSKILNQIKESPALKALANEKAYSMNYAGYEGAVQTFLVPYVSPGYLAELTDNTQPDRNGQYLVESVETHFGVAGARRKVELGVLVGFANK